LGFASLTANLCPHPRLPPARGGRRASDFWLL